MRPPARTRHHMNPDTRTAHRLALALASACVRLDGPNFGDLIDDELAGGDRHALYDAMWAAQNGAWWSAQRSCADYDLLGETMVEFRHLIACLIDGYPVSQRSITEICTGLRELGGRNIFVQLVDICGVDDALELADTYDELNA